MSRSNNINPNLFEIRLPNETHLKKPICMDPIFTIGFVIFNLDEFTQSYSPFKLLSFTRLWKRLSPLAIYSAITTKRGVLMCVSY